MPLNSWSAASHHSPKELKVRKRMLIRDCQEICNVSARMIETKTWGISSRNGSRQEFNEFQAKCDNFYPEFDELYRLEIDKLSMNLI